MRTIMKNQLMEGQPGPGEPTQIVRRPILETLGQIKNKKKTKEEIDLPYEDFVDRISGICR